MDGSLGGVLLLAISLLLFLFVLEMTPASLDEIKEVAASIDDLEVTRFASSPGDPRITFMVCGYSPRGVYHCTYTMLALAVHGEELFVSETIVANVGFMKTGSLHAEFLNDKLMEWGRSKDGKQRPIPEDEEAALLLENLLGMARYAVRHHLSVSIIAASS